jgi:hypothetical protein
METSRIVEPYLCLDLRGAWVLWPGSHGFSHALEHRHGYLYRLGLSCHGEASTLGVAQDASRVMKERFHTDAFEPRMTTFNGTAACRFDWTDGIRHIDAWFFIHGGLLWELAFGRPYQEDGGLPEYDDEFLQSTVESIRVVSPVDPSC